jgi:hypothetical protein
VVWKAAVSNSFISDNLRSRRLASSFDGAGGNIAGSSDMDAPEDMEAMRAERRGADMDDMDDR